ncbi:Gamma-tubulin complex component 5 [Colletotrichum chlorophyti]|uniref:Spindle pole body component n=1 Tax=Colletotrichum chlorophyti TaxID=708187 RepID=A0A1Q8RL62_9PEZI|nr:Gamma-tubulin complex component 5 [Colletotrichum chlorophyti]
MAFAAKLGSLTDELVEVIVSTPDKIGPDRFNILRDSTLRSLRYHNFLRTNQFDVENQLHGLEERFRVHHRESLADVFRERLDALSQFRTKWHPDILHFILELSDQPTQKTRLSDLELLKETEDEPEPKLRWEDIAREDGWHEDADMWRSIDYSDHSGDEYGEPKSERSSVSDDISLSIPDSSIGRRPEDFEITSAEDAALEEVYTSQAWRTEAQNMASERQRKVPVSEFQATREALFMLQGLPTTLFQKDGPPDPTYQMSNVAWDTYKALISSYAESGRQLSQLRSFVKRVQTAPLFQVFRDNVMTSLRLFDKRISEIQARLVVPHEDTIVSMAAILETLKPHLEPLQSLSEIALFDSCSLETSVDALNHIYLMADGAAADAFCKGLFARLDALRLDWHDRYSLTGLAQEAFSSRVDTTRVVVTVRHEGQKKSVVAARDLIRTALPEVLIQYRLPWPVQLVVTEDTISQYQAVFTFLMQIRRAIGLVQRNRILDELATHRDIWGNRALYYSLRSKLVWFCNCIQTYLATLVLAPYTARLYKNLRQAYDVDDMIKVHGTFVRQVVDAACLGKKLDPLRSGILDIMDLAAKLEDAQSASAAEEAEEAQELSRLSLMSSPMKASPRRRKPVTTYAEDSNDEGVEGVRSRPKRGAINAGKGYFESLQEIKTDFERHLRFICGGLRGAARASSDEAATKWDLLAEMLEVGVKDNV